MAIFQFFKHSESKLLTHVNVTSETFYVEKQQLLAQGFEVFGDYIQAATSEEARKKAAAPNQQAVEQYIIATPESGIFYTLKEMYSFIVRQFKSKKVSS